MLKLQMRASLAALMALSLSSAAIAPLFVLQPASAGIFAQSDTQRGTPTRSTGDVPSGTRVRVAEQDNKKIILSPDETFAATLITTEDIQTTSGTIVVPRGTRIEGEFRPARDSGGTQFFARRIMFRDGTERNIDASSNIVDTRQTIRKGINTDSIWQGALVGGGASAIISSIVSNVGIFKVLGGAGIGALAGYLINGRKKSEVVVVEPNQDLDLTFNTDLYLSSL